MAKKQTKTQRKPKSKTKAKSQQPRKGIRRIIPKSRAGKIGLAVFLIAIISITSIYLVFLSILQPSGMGGQGWMKFQFIDGTNGEELQGEVILIQVNHTDKKINFDDFPSTEGLYDNPVKTGDLVYVPERAYAVVWDVDLESGDTRKWQPLSISPIGSEIKEEYETNTFIIWFESDPLGIEANITHIDDVKINATLSDFPIDTKFDMVINITNFNFPAPEDEYDTYGASSWIPEYWLEKKGYDLSLEEEVFGLGLWLAFNGSEIAYADVEDNGEEYTDVYYIESWNTGIVLLDIVMWQTQMEMTLELKSSPIEVFLFEGFLEDKEDTKILMIKEWV